MKKIHSLLLASIIALLLGGCSPGTTVSTEQGSVRSSEDRVTLRASGEPNATIDAEGNLAIDGEQVEVTPQQRAMLQEYQREFSAMTEDGLAIGKQGAAMAGKAVTAAIKGAMGGSGESVEKTMEAEGELIRQEALKLCRRLVTIRGVQDRLAVELPAFKPYATIDSGDVEDCEGSAEQTADEAFERTPTADSRAN